MMSHINITKSPKSLLLFPSTSGAFEDSEPGFPK